MFSLNDEISPQFLYTYASGVYDEKTIGEPSFYYKTDLSIKVGDKVLVDRNDKKVIGEVVALEYYEEDNVPYPLNKTKDILKILSLNNTRKIIFYNQDGTKSKEQELNEDTLSTTNGMKIKCYMLDGTEKIGFSDPYRLHNPNEYDGKIHDYINLTIFDNLDENSHQLVGENESKFKQSCIKVNISEIVKIEVILYSSPRWGGKLTNKFNI